MRGRSLRAVLTAAALGGGLGVAAPTVANAEMYVNVRPLRVPTTAVEVGSQKCAADLGGGPYADRDVWVFELTGDRARAGDFGSLDATFTTLEQRQVTRTAPSAAGGITGGRAWLAVERGARLTAGVAAITGTARNFTVAHTCPAAAASGPGATPHIEPVRAGGPVLEPAAVRPTSTPTPTPTPTVTPTPTPTATIGQLPHGTVDLVEPDADPAPVVPQAPPADNSGVLDTGVYSDGPPADYNDGGVPGTVPGDALPNSGGPYADGTVAGSGAEFDGGPAPYDRGAVVGDGGFTSGDGGYNSGDGGYSSGDGGYSSGGDSGSFSGGGDSGSLDSGDVGDGGASDSRPAGPIDWQTSPTTGLNYSGFGSSTTADIENTPKPDAPAEPAAADAPAASAGPAAVTLRSADDRSGNVLRLTAIGAAFVLAGLGMTLLRRRRRLTRVIGRHRAA